MGFGTRKGVVLIASGLGAMALLVGCGGDDDDGAGVESIDEVRACTEGEGLSEAEFASLPPGDGIADSLVIDAEGEGGVVFVLEYDDEEAASADADDTEAEATQLGKFVVVDALGEGTPEYDTTIGCVEG